MKNKIVWTIGIVLAGAFGFWVWCQRPGLPVEKVLPSRPVVFMRLNHVQSHINQMIHSEFGKNLASINLPEILSRNNFSTRDIRDFQRWQQDLVKCWENPLVRRFLSKEAAIAFYRQDNSYQVFVTLRLTLSTRIFELIGQLSHRWGDDITIKQQKYKGRVINHIFFKKQALGLVYVRVRDLLVIVPGPSKALEGVVDVYKHKNGALQEDPSFHFVRQNAYSKDEGMAFVNLNLFSDLWRGEMDSKLTSLGYQSAAFPVYGLSYMPGTVSKYKMIIGLDEKYMSSGLRKTYACQALNNDTMKLVPVDAIAYHWGGCFDFAQAWETANERLHKNAEVAQMVLRFKEKLETHFNISIKNDVLPVLGQQVGGYLTDVDMQGSYPFPRFLIFVKILDRAKFEAFLHKLVENQPLLRQEEYNQVPLRYISLPLGGNMDPAYALLDDYFLAASSRQLVKRSIDAYHNSLRSIVSDDMVAQFRLSGGQKFHSVTLMKTAELSRRAQDFLGWMDRYLSGQVSLAAAYKQDGDNKKHQLDEAIADKSAELVLAEKKLMQLKNGSLPDTTDNKDPDLLNGTIANLSREEDSIKADIASYREQKADLVRLLDNYATGAQTAKLTMYNMDNFLSPVLKGLESINAQAVTVRFGDKLLETEFLVK